jgi:hypothetical protein
LPNFNKRIIIECDALRIGFSAVLHQGTEPVAYFSRSIATRHAKLVTYERELIDFVQVVLHWRSYLSGRSFVIKTNHYSLKVLLD